MNKSMFRALRNPSSSADEDSAATMGLGVNQSLGGLLVLKVSSNLSVITYAVK